MPAMTKALEVSLPSDRTILMTRLFNAPPALVFDALTKPEMVKRWLLGPDGYSMPVCEIDLKVGGKFRYVWRGPDGSEFGMGGVFREIAGPDRLVHTEVFDGAEMGGESLVTTVLTQEAGKTRFACTCEYESKETRDAVLKSGMEDGAGDSYDRLDVMLKHQPSEAPNEIVVSRLIGAAPEAVFDAFTDAMHISAWWGPVGFTTTTREMDVRPGGVWRFTMHGPDGRDYKNVIRYTDVVRPERIAYDQGGEDETADFQFRSLITFTPNGRKTEVSIRLTFPTTEMRNDIAEKYGAIEGGRDTLERLETHVLKQGYRPMNAQDTSPLDLVLSRVVDAPRELIWRCWTEAEHLTKFFTPKPWTTPFAELDVRPGGVFRTVMRGPDGEEFDNSGIYLEVVKPERLVFTDALLPGYRPAKEPFFSCILTLEDVGGGRTRYTARALHATEATRKKHEEMGFYDGWSTVLDQLVAYANTLKAK
ncbi:MAG: SRPBCC domain-containing protein [Hyphomicrobiales bacterium]|nr:SRPBCC domain-containing protein [Hyphomicrobiales bacterium]